jgi:hypothetical protein
LLCDTLTAIVHYVHTQATPTELLILGYYKDSKSIGVFNLVNDRNFSGTDAEHILCKGWLAGKYTLGHYRNVRHPQPTKPHCHPIRNFHLFEKASSCKVVCTVMQQIGHEYSKEKECLNIPEFCLLPAETPKKIRSV